MSTLSSGDGVPSLVALRVSAELSEVWKLLQALVLVQVLEEEFLVLAHLVLERGNLLGRVHYRNRVGRPVQLVLLLGF